MKSFHYLFTGIIAGMLFVTAPNLPVRADAVPGDYFISLGADLTEKEKTAVYDNLGITQEDASLSKTIIVTNQEEHQYLDSYISSKAIGKRALSSVYIEKAEKDSGINIQTSHITYCTENMYRSALSTAGLTDVNVKITGPYDISGTAALVGTMKAYEEMTGDTIPEDKKDAVNDELVVTKNLAEKVGEDKAEDIIMDLKEKAAEKEDLNSTDLNQLIDEVCEDNDVTLSEDEKNEITRLTKKFDDLDIDINSAMSQAQDIYHGMMKEAKEQNVVERVIQFFKRIFHNFFE